MTPELVRLHVELTPQARANLEAAAKRDGLSIGAYLRILFSTPANPEDSFGEVRKRVAERWMEAEESERHTPSNRMRDTLREIDRINAQRLRRIPYP
jgi:hypothetical protein